jgi:transcriptional regulator with XRE-family HTH domain
MERVGAFPEKLELAMRAVSLSRVALAQVLGVDKSLIGRWLSGAVHPTEHNLARLTALFARRNPDLRLADWFGDSVEFAARLGLPSPHPSGHQDDENPLLLGPFVALSREETARRGAAYEGFWRTSRPSALMPDRIFHDYGMIRRADNGLLEVRMRGAGLNFTGWMMPGEGNLFVYLDDPVGRTPLALMFRGVTLPRAMVIDGLLMLAALDPSRTLAAMPILLERIDDLSDDAQADLERCDQLQELEPEPLEPLEPEVLRARVFRGGEALHPGSLLSVGAADSLSRGSTKAGLSG